MGNNLISIIVNAIKMRFMPLYNKARQILNPTYFRTNVLTAIRTFFSNLFNVKPRNKDDYYELFGWLISKRLAFAIVIVVGVASGIFLYSMRAVFFPKAEVNNIKTYSYNSILLKFAKGKVRIKGKSGYLAYEGDVQGGYCKGQGTLYNPQDHVVYQGAFEKNMYEGSGMSYYPSGTLQYTGTFHENLFSGNGKLYRESGTMEYEGGFDRGMKEGSGVLYDTGQDPLFIGEFSQDDIRYSSLLGDTPEDMATAYDGATTMYVKDNEHLRLMPDIRAMTLEQNDSESVEDELYTVRTVYVLRNFIRFGGQAYGKLSDIQALLGDPIYEGISRATLGEVVAVDYLNDHTDGQVLYGYADMEISPLYTEYSEVESYETGYEVYLHTYKREGLIYTFVGKDNVDSFDFYYVIGEGNEDAAS